MPLSPCVSCPSCGLVHSSLKSPLFVCLQRLRQNVDEETLKRALTPFGKILSLRIVVSSREGRQKRELNASACLQLLSSRQIHRF
jgi:hypothetical protein